MQTKMKCSNCGKTIKTFDKAPEDVTDEDLNFLDEDDGWGCSHDAGDLIEIKEK